MTHVVRFVAVRDTFVSIPTFIALHKKAIFAYWRLTLRTNVGRDIYLVRAETVIDFENYLRSV